tara:strand:- start:465 stop:593 length:129 start_codon:yes stop_codon:yes gene_type:complete
VRKVAVQSSLRTQNFSVISGDKGEKMDDPVSQRGRTGPPLKY